MDEEYSPVAPAANGTSHTVWLQQDTTTRQAQSYPLESHWSRQITQPLIPPPPWPIQQPFTRRAAISSRPESRAVGLGVGCGAVVAFLTLSLLLLMALNSRLLYGRASTGSDVLPRPTSVQPSPTHTPRVRPTPAHSVGGQSAGSHTGAQKPIPTTVPTTPPTATAQPTPMATPSLMPTDTPAPTVTPTPQPTQAPAPSPSQSP